MRCGRDFAAQKIVPANRFSGLPHAMPCHAMSCYRVALQMAGFPPVRCILYYTTRYGRFDSFIYSSERFLNCVRICLSIVNDGNGNGNGDNITNRVPMHGFLLSPLLLCACAATTLSPTTTTTLVDVDVNNNYDQIETTTITITITIQITTSAAAAAANLVLTRQLCWILWQTDRRGRSCGPRIDWGVWYLSVRYIC